MWCRLFFRDCWIRLTYAHYKGLLWVTESRGQYQREHSHFKQTNHCVGLGPFSLESQICVLTSRWRRFDSPDSRNVEPMRGGQKWGSKRYSDIRIKSNFRKRGTRWLWSVSERGPGAARFYYLCTQLTHLIWCIWCIWYVVVGRYECSGSGYFRGRGSSRCQCGSGRFQHVIC